MDIKFLTTPLSSQADFSSNALCTFRKMAYFFFLILTLTFFCTMCLFLKKKICSSIFVKENNSLFVLQKPFSQKKTSFFDSYHKRDETSQCFVLRKVPQ